MYMVVVPVHVPRLRALLAPQPNNTSARSKIDRHAYGGNEIVYVEVGGLDAEVERSSVLGPFSIIRLEFNG